jgi:ketosteroid isomerase-like protein
VTNREIAERAFAALERRDLDAFLDYIHPEAEFTSLIAEAEGQTFHGHEGVRDWWERVAGSLGGLEFALSDVEEHGDRMVGKVTVTGRLGDTPVSQSMYQVLWMSDGKARSWRFFRERGEAEAST